MNSDLKQRTKIFALAVVRFYTSLPKTTEMQVLGKQFLRSGTSVGAHYREACRSRSDAEFISKIEGGLQEWEESAYWLELLVELSTVHSDQARHLLEETNQLTAIFITCVKKVKARRS